MTDKEQVPVVQAEDDCPYCAGVEEVEAVLADGKRDYIPCPHPVHRQNHAAAPSNGLREARDDERYEVALTIIANWPFTDPNDQDAANMAKVARDALAALPPVDDPKQGDGEAFDGGLVAGPVWREQDEESEIWTAEVQALGGHAVIATVHGMSRDHAEQRQQLILSALTRPSAAPSEVPAGWRTDWERLDEAANRSTGDDGEDSFNIGRRDGFSEAVQALDVLTGGDGEYRFCSVPDERHCPDPDAMIARIVARCASPVPADQGGEG